MQEITFNDVRGGVLSTLAASFPDIKVYSEEGKDGAVLPCFYVKLMESKQIQELGRRYARHHPFEIRYLTPDNKSDDMYDMAERLTKVLEFISVGGRSIRGANMRFEIIDKVLHFYVNYNFLVWEARPNVPKMQTFEQKEGIKQ